MQFFRCVKSISYCLQQISRMYSVTFCIHIIIIMYVHIHPAFLYTSHTMIVSAKVWWIYKCIIQFFNIITHKYNDAYYQYHNPMLRNSHKVIACFVWSCVSKNITYSIYSSQLGNMRIDVQSSQMWQHNQYHYSHIRSCFD